MSEQAEPIAALNPRNDPETAEVLQASLQPDNEGRSAELGGQSVQAGRKAVERPDAAQSTQNALALEIEAAICSGHYLIAVWRLTDNRVHLYRELRAFPESDVPVAEQLLRDDLANFAAQSTSLCV